MSPRVDLRGLRILVVEDEYFVAVELCEVLKTSGAEVIGPAPTVDKAIEEMATGDVHGAVLDVNLRGEAVFAVSDLLKAQGVPLLYVTGYDREALPEERRGAVVLGKPIDADRLVRAAARLFRRSPDASA